MDQVTLIALGSNQPSPAGRPIETLRAALSILNASDGIALLRVSPFYQTPAYPPGSGPDYINSAASFKCHLAPRALMDRLHEVERSLARKRKTRWAARTIDLDLLDCAGAILPDRVTWRKWHELPEDQQSQIAPEDLILPHPRLQDRGFVLMPLNDIAPDWRHPILDQSVREMLAALPQNALNGIIKV